MAIQDYFYPSDLLPAAPVAHGYRNVWIRDNWYKGICSPEPVRRRIWKGLIGIADRYKWKLEIHAKTSPRHWYEHVHVRYSPEGKEIGNEPWLHNQFDSHGNWLEVCLDENRLDLAELFVDYLNTVKYAKKPAAGAWEDRNSCDAYSIACCLKALQRAKHALPHKRDLIDDMIKHGCRRLYCTLLPFATNNRLICLSLLGIIWPLDMAGPYRQEIIDLVKKNLMREPFGFIRYVADSYTGEHFTQGKGTEYPWLLGDLWMAHIEPENPLWMERVEKAQKHFSCMPEAFHPVTLKANRNTPLLWAEAMRENLLRGGVK